MSKPNKSKRMSTVSSIMANLLPEGFSDLKSSEQEKMCSLLLLLQEKIDEIKPNFNFESKTVTVMSRKLYSKLNFIIGIALDMCKIKDFFPMCLKTYVQPPKGSTTSRTNTSTKREKNDSPEGNEEMMKLLQSFEKRFDTLEEKIEKDQTEKEGKLEGFKKMLERKEVESNIRQEVEAEMNKKIEEILEEKKNLEKELGKLKEVNVEEIIVRESNQVKEEIKKIIIEENKNTEEKTMNSKGTSDLDGEALVKVVQGVKEEIKVLLSSDLGKVFEEINKKSKSENNGEFLKELKTVLENDMKKIFEEISKKSNPENNDSLLTEIKTAIQENSEVKNSDNLKENFEKVKLELKEIIEGNFTESFGKIKLELKEIIEENLKPIFENQQSQSQEKLERVISEMNQNIQKSSKEDSQSIVENLKKIEENQEKTYKLIETNNMITESLSSTTETLQSVFKILLGEVKNSTEKQMEALMKTLYSDAFNLTTITDKIEEVNKEISLKFDNFKSNITKSIQSGKEKTIDSVNCEVSISDSVTSELDGFNAYIAHAGSHDDFCIVKWNCSKIGLFKQGMLCNIILSEYGKNIIFIFFI